MTGVQTCALPIWHRQFLRRLDHELKNPLTAVRAAVADASPGAPPGVVVNLEVVDAQSRRMSRLLTDLRKLAELETASLALEDVDLAETVTDAVDAVVEEAAGRNTAAINSSADDFGITFEGEKERGFFSSNRGDARGWDHIYSFEYPTITIQIEGYMSDVEEYAKIGRAHV